MATISSNPAMQDLKITFQESTLVFPSQETVTRSLFLSNIDQILNYSIPTVFFFSANPDYPPQVVCKRLKLAVEKVLVPYDFMAGRLKLNQESGRLEIDCNAAGAGFVVASSEFSLDELGDLVCPNLAFQQLAVQTLDNPPANKDNQPLFILQVTSFKCGGFAIGMCVNHILLDGLSARTFNENLASQAFDDKPFAAVPCLNRSLLAARSPPLVEFSHPEFFIPKNLPNSGPPVFDCKKEELVSKIFKLSSSDIAFLKNKATPPLAAETNATAPARISSFNVAAALIWRCKALSYDDDCNKDRVSTLLNVVDLRSRLNPPLPPSYCGNAVLVAYSSAECGNIEKGPFSKLVEMVSEAPKRITNAYVKSVIDWLEMSKGIPCGEYMVSSWLRLGFEQVEYPWGKPVHSGPLVNHRKDICWVFPAVDGINALVSLPPKEMERFESQFHNFFAKIRGILDDHEEEKDMDGSVQLGVA
ncbi:hypothetical protein CDL12_06902 [Handroanthus impetiginosus]|uniref:Omega-hydroxypalmitate O-feruloyl transferase n=1 Tax=Handroanthus impetiginosus TaxID=429701 RepID=A0A2G9HSD5_9LAMI|nr:hypothetical protein CDL12_06902 [Handroanthus impetiginosus]